MSNTLTVTKNLSQSAIPVVAHVAQAQLPPMIDDFTDIYDLYHEAIFRYCYWKCRDREIAKDLMQDVFLRFCQCLQRKEEIVHVRAFLYCIAHNLFLNHVRRKKEASLDQLLETGFEPAIDPWHHTFSELDCERPLQKLAEMPSTYRHVLQNRFIRGFLPAEIATMTGESSNTISVRIFRGLKHLRTLLKDAPLGSRENFLLSSYGSDIAPSLPLQSILR